MAELPSGTVTFLFTDLEGSTRLWEQRTGAMKPALARHDAILRRAIKAHSGQAVKATGDGILAVFAAADDAVESAVDAQRALSAESWADTGELRVRMGLHTGMAERRAGDYFGSALNRAARLMEVAHGGQVVCSAVTAELAQDTLAKVELRDLGEHRLRDLSRPERVFQVCAPGLVSEFAPLRSLGAVRGNLPVQLSSFVGRAAEVKATIEALAGSRAVTLTGVGGVGKTRLALQVAAEVAAGHRDGAWLCELASATDPEAMVQVISATLGVQPREGTSLAGSICEFLEAKTLLLILDNCEHLLDPAGQIACDILHGCPKVRILATSREGLGIEGEHIRVVRSLGLPEASSGPDDAMTADAVRLFVDRAHAAAADFCLDGTHVAAVADVCRRLDGVPLAIELAAARVAVMSPREVAVRLDERFRLLTGGRRSAVERHHTLRATVDWSYSLLSETEQRVFVRLGAFVGTFSAAAAEAVASGDGIDQWEVLEAVASLVSKSMVVVDHLSTDGTSRYAMLETLRAYARERMGDGREADEWRRRHARYYAAFADDAGAGLTSADELGWRPRVRAELDNFRAAVGWATDADDVDDLACGMGIIASLANEASLDLTSGVGVWATSALPRIHQMTPALRTAVLGAAAFQATFLGDFDRALQLSGEALADGIPADCPAHTAYVAWTTALLSRGEFRVALDILVEGLGRLEAANASDYAICAMHVIAAVAAAASNDPTLSRAHADQSVAMARRTGVPSLLASALYSLGEALLLTDPGSALALFEECVVITQRGATDIALSPALGQIGALRAGAGDAESAIVALHDAVIHSLEVGHRPTLSGTLDRCVHAFASLELDEPAGVLAGVISEGVLAGMSDFYDWNAAQLVLEGVRRRIGDDQYNHTVRHGAGLVYEEVVQYLRQLFDDLTARELRPA